MSPFAFLGRDLPHFCHNDGTCRGICREPLCDGLLSNMICLKGISKIASLQEINGIFHLRFRYGGKPFRRSLGVDNRDDAESSRKQVEVNLHRIQTGIIEPPPATADIPQYVLSGGKSVARPVVESPSSPSLQQLWDGYLQSLPHGSKEKNSLATESTHFRHLIRILKPNFLISDLTTEHLQKYILARTPHKGLRGSVKACTISKEISSFRNVWNNDALPRKIVDKDFRSTFGKLNYPKTRERPPFQTWEQIPSACKTVFWSRTECRRSNHT